MDDKFKRDVGESEGDEQQQLSLAKKFKDCTLQPIAVGLELELNTKSYTYLEIEGIRVGGSDNKNRDEEEPIRTEKGIQGLLTSKTQMQNDNNEALTC